MATPKDPRALLPEGYAWRRGALQLIERLGALPGDRVVVLAPAAHDPTPALAARLPRVQWLQVGGGPFDWDEERDPSIVRVRTDPHKPPFEDESLDAVVDVFSVPLLAPEDHEAFIEAWAHVLAPFGKWLALLALESSKDPRLKQTEQTLKENEFTRVRSNRLGGGGAGATIAIASGRKE